MTEPMTGVREYAEGLPVRLGLKDGRPTVEALNEAGHDGTEVDLLDLLAWVKANRPGWWEAGETREAAKPLGCAGFPPPAKTPEQWAEEILDALIGDETTMGWFGPGRHNDPNRWRPNGTAGECYVKILAVVREMIG